MRHNQIKHHILQLSRRAGYTVVDEPPLLSEIESNKKGKRGDGLIYHATEDQKNIIFDVTFIDPQNTTSISNGAARDTANALRARENYKIGKYRTQMNRVAESTIFRTLAMTIYGSINNHTKILIEQLTNRVSEITGIPKSIIIKQYHNEISVMIAKSNGEIILNHCVGNGRGQDYLLDDPELMFNQQTNF